VPLPLTLTLTLTLACGQAKLDGYVERSEERQRTMETTLKAILARLEGKLGENLIS
jgi:hypothetical protein